MNWRLFNLGAVNASRFWQRPVMTATTYYYLSWQILVASTLLMAAISNSCTTTAIVISMLLSFTALIAYRRLSPRILQKVRLSGYLFCTLLLLWAFTGERDQKDIASIAMEVLLAALPALIQDMGNQRRAFSAIAVVNLISIGSIMLSDNLNSYSTFLIFILCMTSSLNATRMYFLSRNAADATEQLPVNFFYQLLRVVPLGVVFGAMIFYWFPRMNDIAFDLNVSGFRNRTGYTNEVNLGTKGSIEAANRINLWVASRNIEWLERSANNLYIRGTSLDQFDGKTWRNSRQPMTLAVSAKDLRRTRVHEREMVDLTFFREATSAKEIFYPHALWQLELPARMIQEVFVDDAGNISRTFEASYRFQYDVKISQTPEQSTDGMTMTLPQYRSALASLPEFNGMFYQLDPRMAGSLVKVPDEIASSDWFRAFAREVDSNLAAAPESMPINQVLRGLQRFFRQHYKASLRVEYSGNNNLREFIADRKEGHCELFATATALYLRNAGIPVRLVAGYMGGHFNLMSQMLEVPEKNAHVWLEIFQPGSGWLNYDPTPLILAREANVLSDNLAMIGNAFKFWFTRYVIDYDSRAQRELVVTVSRIDMSKLLDFEKVSLDRDTGELVALGILLIIALWLLARVITREDYLPDAPPYYRSLARRLIAQGFTKKSGESYLEYHKRLWEAGLNPELLSTAHFALERDLYGATGLSRAEQKALGKILRNMPLRIKTPAAGRNNGETGEEIKAPQNGPSRKQAHG